MHHPITVHTIRFTISEPFDYLEPGVTYRGTPYRKGKGARIDQDDESSGTFLQGRQWARLISGAAGFQKI